MGIMKEFQLLMLFCKPGIMLSLYLASLSSSS